MPSNPPFIDLWIVERILKENHTQEVNNLRAKLDAGLRIKNDKNRFVTTDLEVLRKRMEDEANEPLHLEDGTL